MICSIGFFIQMNNVSIENETDWLQMANFYADWTKKFYDVIVPFIKGWGTDMYESLTALIPILKTGKVKK